MLSPHQVPAGTAWEQRVLKAPRDRARHCWSDPFLPGAGGARAPSSGSGTGTRAPPANLYSWPESLTLFCKGRECSLLPSQHPPSRSNGASSDSDDSRGGRQSGPVALNQVVSGATADCCRNKSPAPRISHSTGDPLVPIRAARSSPSRSPRAPRGRSTWPSASAPKDRCSSPPTGGGWTGMAPPGSSAG